MRMAEEPNALDKGEGAPHQRQRHRRSSCRCHMIPSADNKKMTMILRTISSPTSSSTLRLMMLTYSCLIASMARLVAILIQLRRNPLAPHVSSLLLRRCLQQLAPSPSQADAAKRSILSPSTLHKAATEQIKVGACSKSENKKGRKRKKGSSSSQPPMPIRAQDGPPSPKDLSYAIHVAGRPMLPPKCWTLRLRICRVCITVF